VSANRRHLEHGGRPYFYLADTSWKLLTAPTEAEPDWVLILRAASGRSSG
jgi:hypothetical protein